MTWLNRQPIRHAAFRSLPPRARGLRIGLLGGSFNPPHAAHRAVSLLALRRLQLDASWWLVTPGNPLKDVRDLPPLETRLAAARMLLRPSNTLLLDEPTNHLDIPSLEWLERYLVDLDAAVVLVAHDRWFLEAVGTSVLELEAGRARFFAGPWHAWRKEQAERITRRRRPDLWARHLQAPAGVDEGLVRRANEE